MPASVRSASSSLKALSCVGLAPAKAWAAKALAPLPSDFGLGRLDAARACAPGHQTHTRPAAVGLHDGSHGDEGEGIGRAVPHLAVDVHAGRPARAGSTASDQLAMRQCMLDMGRVSPGSLWKSAIGMRRVWPSGLTVSTCASSARIATAMSLGMGGDAVFAAEPMTASDARQAAYAPSSRCPAGACCRAGRCRRNRGNACAGAGCRPSSPCCAAGPRPRPAARATARG